MVAFEYLKIENLDFKLLALHQLQHVHLLHCSTVTHPKIFSSGAKIEYFIERMDPGLSFREKLEVNNHPFLSLIISVNISVLILVLTVELEDLI